MKTRTLAAIIIGLAICSHASAAPSAKQILQNVHKAYTSVKSLQLVGTTSESAAMAGKKQSSSVGYNVWFQRPAKLRYEVKQGDVKQLIVSDGKYIYMLSSKAKEYRKIAVKDGLKSLAGLSGGGIGTMSLLVGMDPSKLAAHSKVVGEGKVGGADSYIVQINLDKNGKALQKLWVGKKDWFVRKNETKMTISGKNGSGTIVTTSTTSSLRANPSIKASTFVFTPPKGVKQFDARKAAEQQKQMIQKMGDALNGKPAPSISLKDINGRNFSLASTRGKVVLVNFWVSTYPPSKAYMSMLQKLYNANKSKGFDVVAVSVDAKPQDAKSFSAKNKLSYHVLSGSKTELQTLAKSYRVVAIPTSYIINKSGNVVSHFVGPVTESQLLAAMKKAGL